MNVERESRTERDALTLDGSARRALEARIAQASERLFEDLNRFPIVVRRAAGAIERGVLISLAVGALLTLGAIMVIAQRARRRRIRISWR